MNNCNYNCPPNYSITPTPPIPCSCCPAGYTYNKPTPKYPKGFCINGKTIIDTIPCNACAEIFGTDCILYNGTALKCLGVQPGMSINEVLAIIEKKCELLMNAVNRPLQVTINQ